MLPLKKPKKRKAKCVGLQHPVGGIKKVKKNKATIKKKLTRQLDSQWSAIIHSIYGDKCAICGRYGNCSAHHFFGRKAYPSLKWDIDNGILLCFVCHIIGVHRKGNTEPAREALINRIGQDRFDILKVKGNQVMHYKDYDLTALLDTLVKHIR